MKGFSIKIKLHYMTNRRSATLAQRKSAIDYIHQNCITKGALLESYIYRRFHASKVLSKLLQLGVIKKTEQPNQYDWDPQVSVEDALYSTWQYAPRVSEVFPAELPVANNLPEWSVAQRVEKAVEWAKQYAIARDSEFIMDAVNGQGIFQHLKSEATCNKEQLSKNS